MDLLSDSTNNVIQGVDLNANNLPPMIPDEEEELYIRSGKQ